jgi:hypothetical protein
LRRVFSANGVDVEELVQAATAMFIEADRLQGTLQARSDVADVYRHHID